MRSCVAACGGDDDDGGASGDLVGRRGDDRGATAFPVTVEGDNGSVTLEEQPDEIVSLSATATESLFAIGAGDQVIAVDDQSNYPADAPITDLSGFQPNIEAIAGYEPDLVVAAYDPGGLVERAGEARHPRAPPGCGRATSTRRTSRSRLSGTATGNAEGADDGRANRCGPRSRSLVHLVPAAEGATVYHELGPDFFSATSDTFIGSVYELFGLVNIADAAADADAGGYPQLSGEYIVSESPDLIVLADTKCCGQTAKKVAKRPGWDQIEAVENGDIVEADDNIASRWGPRTVEFVELIAGSLEGVSQG